MTDVKVTKSELIEILAKKLSHLPQVDVELARLNP